MGLYVFWKLNNNEHNVHVWRMAWIWFSSKFSRLSPSTAASAWPPSISTGCHRISRPESNSLNWTWVWICLFARRVACACRRPAGAFWITLDVFSIWFRRREPPWRVKNRREPSPWVRWKVLQRYVFQSYWPPITRSTPRSNWTCPPAPPGP
ncbi:hypothetical protein D9M71_263330 [compost metagenome]